MDDLAGGFEDRSVVNLEDFLPSLLHRLFRALAVLAEELMDGRNPIAHFIRFIRLNTASSRSRFA